MSDGVKKSDSRGDINLLLRNIRGIIDSNNKVLSDCKDIQQKNNETKNTKRFVDIVALTAGRKRNEIDIPHTMSRAGERQSEIKYQSERPRAHEELSDIPVIEAEKTSFVHAAPPPPDNDARDRSRERSKERRARSRERSKERSDRLAWLRNKDYSSVKPKPPDRRAKPDEDRPTVGTPSDRKSRPRSRTWSSEGDPSCRPSLNIRIRKDSDNNSIDIIPEYVAENHVVYETTTPPCSPYLTRSERSTPVRSPCRSPAGFSRNPYMENVLSRSSSLAEILKDKYFIETSDLLDDYHSIEDPDSPRSTLSRDYSPRQCRRRIVLERCKDCDGLDTPPEIEIKICSKDRCVRNYRFTPERVPTPSYDTLRRPDEVRGRPDNLKRSPDNIMSKPDYLNRPTDIRVKPDDVRNGEDQPDPPHRTSSLNRIYNARPQSPSSIEVERMSRRLERLKRDVETLAKQSPPPSRQTPSPSMVPISVRVGPPEDDIPSTSYPPNNKTTSTTDILTYHPAKEEFLASQAPITEETHTVSTHTIDDTDNMNIGAYDRRNSGLIEEDFPLSYSSRPPPIPLRVPHSPPTKDTPTRNSMSKINYDTNEDIPPPMPPRNISSPKSLSHSFSSSSPAKPEITLIPENLYDPMHIGTTYMLLSKKYHGMFKFANPEDPNARPTTLKPTPKSEPYQRKLYQPKSYDYKPKSSDSVSSPEVDSPVRPRSAGLYAPSSSPAVSLSREDPPKPPSSSPPTRSGLDNGSPSRNNNVHYNNPPSPSQPRHEPSAPIHETYQPSYEPYQPRRKPSPSSPRHETYQPSYEPYQPHRKPSPSPPRQESPQPRHEPSPPRSPKNDPRYVSVLPRKFSTESIPMSPEQRRKFNRPYKAEPNYREVPVDCGAGAPPDVHIMSVPQKTPILERRDPATKAYMLQNISGDQRDHVRDGLSNDASPEREPLPVSSPSLYGTNSLQRSSLRMKIPNVKFLGDEWKELAQALGFDNMTISNISAEYPNPGLAMIEIWAKQSGSELEELLYHLKNMNMWSAADTLERTVSPISV